MKKPKIPETLTGRADPVGLIGSALSFKRVKFGNMRKPNVVLQVRRGARGTLRVKFTDHTERILPLATPIKLYEYRNPE